MHSHMTFTSSGAKMEKHMSLLVLVVSICYICVSVVAVPWDRRHPACSLCQTLVESTAAQITQSDGQDDAGLISMADFCRSQTDPSRTQSCLQFVESNGLTIVNYLLSGQSLDQVCAHTGSCPRAEILSKNNIIDVGLQNGGRHLQPAEMKMGARCELCKFFVKLIDSSLEDQKTLSTVSIQHMKICNSIRNPVLKPACQSLDLQILKFLAQGYEPGEACKMSQVCPASSSLYDINAGNIRSLSCDTCNILIEDLAIELNAVTEGMAEFCEAVRLCDSEGNDITFNSVQSVLHNDEASLKCEICEFLIDMADEYLKNNHSEAAINATIYKLCNDLPASFQPLCFAYAPQIVAALAHGIDPQKVCTEIKLCNGNSTSQVNHPVSKPNRDVKPEASLECEICEFLINMADEYLKNNHSEAAINATIYKLCNDLPASFQPLCFAYAPQIVAALAHGIDPQKVCTEIKLCTGNGTTLFFTHNPKHKVSSVECDVCEFVISLADSFLSNKNFTPAEANNTVYQICANLPASFRQYCLSLAPKVVEILLDGVDPVTGCTKLKLCTGGQNVSREKIYRHIPISTKLQSKMSVKDKASTIECELCEFVVNLADEYIKNKNFTPEQVNKTVFEICNDLPAVFQPLCYQYAPKIVKALVDGVDPVKVCTDIKLCTGNENINQKDVKASTIECELCEFVVNLADEYIKNKNFTPEQVNKTVFEICNDLPAAFQPLCYQYAPKIVKALVDGVDPVKVCTDIKLCTGNENINQKDVKASTIECELCEFVVNLADEYIKNKNFTPEQVNKTVFEICNDLPAAFQPFCYQYAPMIVKALVDGVDPVKVCTDIKLCTGNENINQKDVKASTIECELCEFVVNLADEYIKNKNFTPEQVNKTVFEICNDLPAAFQPFCYQYAPMIVKALVDGVDPVKVCTDIKLCTGNENINQKDVKASTIECELCEFVVNLADEYIKNKNFTPEQVNKTVFEICNDLPAAFQPFCYQYAPKIVKALVDGVDPVKVCTDIKLCTGNENINQKDVKASTIECELCEFVVNLADEYIKNKNFTPEQVNKTVFEICNDLPAAFQPFCYQYAPMIVKALVNGVDPVKVCTDIKLCTETKPAVQTKLPEDIMVPTSTECVLCQGVVKILDGYLKKQALSHKDFNHLVNHACGLLSPELTNICYSLAPSIVKFLSEGLDPKVICTELSVCEGEQELYSYLHSLPQLKSLECDACKIMMATLDDDLYRNEGKVKNVLIEVCHRLPPPTDQKCLDYVNNNFDELWDKLLEKYLSPDGVCKLLKLCP